MKKSGKQAIPNGDLFEYVAEKLMLRYFRAIRRCIREKGISQSQLAERLGVSQAYISKLLKYNQNLTIRSLAELAEALDMEWEQPHLVPKATRIRFPDFDELSFDNMQELRKKHAESVQDSVLAETSPVKYAAEPANPPVQRKRGRKVTKDAG